MGKSTKMHYCHCLKALIHETHRTCGCETSVYQRRFINTTSTRGKVLLFFLTTQITVIALEQFFLCWIWWGMGGRKWVQTSRLISFARLHWADAQATCYLTELQPTKSCFSKSTLIHLTMYFCFPAPGLASHFHTESGQLVWRTFPPL